MKGSEIEKATRIRDFYKRWNIDLSEDERWNLFKNRVLNTLCVDTKLFSSDLTISEEFFQIRGIHRLTEVLDDIIFSEIKNDPVYRHILHEYDTRKFILDLEIIFLMETIDVMDKICLLDDIEKAIIASGVPLEVKRNRDGGVLFYPAGAKLLDEKLVNDNLEWLEGCPECYKNFCEALKYVGVAGKERIVVDSLRLSLELLMKKVLGNGKSIENQKDEIGRYLKEMGVSTEISNLFRQVTDYYCKYQNNKAKHDDRVPVNEVEFILYQTGSLMRFLLTVAANE